MDIPQPWSGYHAGPAACRAPACFQPETAGTSWSYSRSPSGYEPDGEEWEGGRLLVTTTTDRKNRLTVYLFVCTLTILAKSSPSSSQATPPGLYS